jgi:hypothetical protein
LLTDAGDDRGRWAEAICDEITDRSTGLVTRDHLDMRFAEFERKFAEFEARMTRQIIFTQVAGFTALVVVLLVR